MDTLGDTEVATNGGPSGEGEGRVSSEPPAPVTAVPLPPKDGPAQVIKHAVLPQAEVGVRFEGA